jgi:hypothetical protein
MEIIQYTSELSARLSKKKKKERKPENSVTTKYLLVLFSVISTSVMATSGRDYHWLIQNDFIQFILSTSAKRKVDLYLLADEQNKVITLCFALI